MTLLTTERTLTDYEQAGFSIAVNLADGHAYHELSTGQLEIVDRLDSIWRATEKQSIPESESHFIEAFSSLVGSAGVSRVAGSLVLPTASNSIDLIAAYLKLMGSRVMLTHPTFDNLALLLRRRGVPITPIAEDEIVDSSLLSRRLKDVDVLFLVNPNNPTGTHLSKQEFCDIVDTCTRAGKTLIIDASFRLYYPQQWDSYSLLVDAGSSYIVFEDTGKVFPTQDMKASLLSFSNEHSPALRELYNEIYLCVSKFSLGVLSAFFDEANPAPYSDMVFHKTVAARRKLLRDRIDTSYFPAISRNSRIGVEWMSIPESAESDTSFVRSLHSNGLAVLPGRNFFWDSVGSPETVRNIRVSLLKPLPEFERGIAILSDHLAKAVS